MEYSIDYECNDDGDPRQALLNRIYGYQNDIPTKIQHRKRINLFFSMMKDLKKRGLIKGYGEAADIGCGSGIYSSLISGFGFEKVTGIDICRDSLDCARQQFSSIEKGKEIIYLQKDAQEFHPDSLFDLVLCTEVIEHTENPLMVVDNIRNMLKPDGIAIISMPNLVSIPMFELIAGSKLRKKPLDHESQQHLDYPFFFVIDMFKKRGYEIVQYQGTNLFVGAFSTKFLYGKQGFAVLNRLDSYLSKNLPWCCFAQYFYIVVRKSENSGDRI